MKTLNYGEIPLYEDFKKAFEEDIVLSTGYYVISIPDGNPDLQVMNYALNIMESDSIDIPDEECEEQDTSVRSSWQFSCKQLYKLVETLISIEPEHIEKMYGIELHEDHWPIGFASSILYTLGIELI